ncbi:MAG TPA: SpoIIE family protein phosphatase [Pseudonocardiaceae bacterium]|nr:SpoIIE family protein phosphatase [Pseudonocardiaceae bacterium]
MSGDDCLPPHDGSSAQSAAEGEMYTRIRALDWSGTPVGPIQDWPQNLCTAVGIMLESRHPMLIWWGPGFTMFYNDAFMALAGSKHPAGLGQHGWEMFADIWPTIGPMLNGVLSTGAATWVDDQLLVMNRHGLEEETYWTYSYSPIRDSDGRVDGIFTATTDTTARVLGERRLRTLRELGEIAAVEAATVEDTCAAALRVLTRNRADVPYALAYVLDDDAATARLVASFGLRAGSPMVPVSLPDPRYGADIWKVATTGQATLSSDVHHGTFVGGDGTIGEASPPAAVVLPLVVGGRAMGALVAGMSPYRALDDDYRSFFDLIAGQVSTVVADVRAYQAERRRAEALAQLDQAKTEFFANISHEFRTPLTLLMGPLAELRTAPAVAADARSRENVEMVHRSGLRLGKLVNSLLDFSRIQAGRLEAAYEPVDLAAFTLELASVFRAAVEQAGLAFELDCPPLGEVVHVDRDMWEKIVLNLLSNALKFTFDGRITVSLRAEPSSVTSLGGLRVAVLRVTDTGTGVAKEDLPRLFERFYRAEHATARSAEGSGIGLALVRELVGLHGGTITVQSTVDVGTTFTVTLPFGCEHLPAKQLRAAAAGAAPLAQVEPFVAEALRWLPSVDTAPTGAASDADQPAMSQQVLVVDDNADMREYLQRLLSRRYRVYAVGDGLTALAAAREQPPDLIISDVMMPNLDGIGLITALRADSRTAQVPVLLLSARAGPEAAVEGLDSGADDYLVKPFFAEELLARVRSNLELARLRTQESAWRSTLISAMQDGMFVADPDGTIAEVNGAFADILGYGAEDLPYVPPYPWWPDPVQEPEEFAQVRAASEAAMRSRGDGRWVLPMRHGLDDRRIWLSIASGVVTSPDGTIQAFVGTARDVTAEHLTARRDAAVARLTGRLGEASDVHGVLTAGLAELAANWITHRALMLTWDTAEQVSAIGTGTSWAALPPATRATISQIRTTGRMHSQLGDRSVNPPASTAVGAPVRCGTQVNVVWLELDPTWPFDSEDAALLSDLAGHLGHALTRAQLFDEQRTASLTLQRAILGPTVLPAGFAVRYEPAISQLAVGGDWYDIVELGADRVGVVVGDCVGHGLAAAAVMGQLRTACRTLLLQDHTAPHVLAAMDHVAALIPDAVCTTLFCAIIDRATGTMGYSCAGHPPAIVARADGRTELLDGARSVPLATVDVARLEATAVLAPGDTVLLYTDGLVERRNVLLDTGIGRAREVLAQAHHLAPVEIADRLAEQLLSDGHDDDVAYLLYQHPLGVGRTVTTTVPAHLQQLAVLRRTVRQWLTATAVDQHTAQELVLAVGEAVTNAVEHAYLDSEPGSVELTVSRYPEELRLEVRDHGRWRTIPAPGPRGRGLKMMEKLTDAVTVDIDDDGTTVRLCKRLLL